MIRYSTLPEEYKKRSRGKLNHAVTNGKILKESCLVDNEDCVTAVQAHHPDYRKPLDVWWLCVKHHSDYHIGWLTFESDLS